MILILTAHPLQDSLTCSIAGEISKTLTGNALNVINENLYSISAFNPVMNKQELLRKTSIDPAIQRYMNIVEQAKGYVIAHPDWWGGPPAILKGWIDRVLRPQTAYLVPEGFTVQNPQPLLSGRKALVIVTSDQNSPEPLKEFWCQRVWKFCGVEPTLLFLPSVRNSHANTRNKFMETAKHKALELFKE